MIFNGKQIARLFNIDGPQLTSPRVHVLKDVLVDDLKMPHIIHANKRLMFKLMNTKIRRLRLELS